MNKLQSPVKVPTIAHNEQATPADFERICSLPYDALKNALAVIFGGQSGKFSGLDVLVKNDDGQYNVYCKPGFGIVTEAVNQNIISGTYIINNTVTELLFPVPVKMPTDKEVTFRVFLKFAIKEADVEKRNFVKEDGGILSHDTPTTMEYTFEGGYSFDTPGVPTSEFGELTIGYVTVNGNIITINNVADNPLTVYSHRTKDYLDHPQGSVHSDHLNIALGGGYVEGTDLSLLAMSNFLSSLRGRFASPNERISNVIDENGEVVTSSVEDVAESIVQSYLGSLTDGAGGLSKRALDNLQDESGRPAIYRIGVVGSSCSGDNGAMKIPEGFTLDETIFITSIGNLQWKNISNSTVTLYCAEASRGIAVAYAHVVGTSYDIRSYAGSVNYLAIAIKPRQQ